LVRLRRQRLRRVGQGGLDDREHVKRVPGQVPVEQPDGGQRQRRQRLVEREVVLQVHGQPPAAALLVRLVQPLHHPAGQQGTVDGEGAPDVPALRGRRFVVVGE